MKHYLPLLLTLSLPLLFSSCASKPTLGDRLISQGSETRELGENWKKGDSLVAEGEKQKRKGRKMVADGEKLLSKGEKNLERGKELKTRSESAAGSVE